jgi:hypothetical protein
MIWLLPVSGGTFGKPANGSVPDAEARETEWAGSSPIWDLTRYRTRRESCYISDSAIGSQIRLYTAPQGNALNNHSPMSFSSPASTSSSSSSSTRSVHPASQVDPATHSQALIDLLELDISREVIGRYSYSFRTKKSLISFFQNML